MLTLSEVRKVITAGPNDEAEVLAAPTVTSERLARAMAALANAHGGVIVIVLDAGSLQSVADLRDCAAQAMLMTEPHLTLPLPYLVQRDAPKEGEHGRGAEGEKGSKGDSHPLTPSPTLPDSPPPALVIEIAPNLPHAYHLDGRYYIRQSARNELASARALRTLLMEREDGGWEDLSPPGCSMDDLDWKQVDAYAARLLTPHVPSLEDVLLHRGCICRRGKGLRPTHAGLLLFGRDPQAWVRGAEVLAVRYAGTEAGEVFTRQTIGGRLPEQIRAAELFLADTLGRRVRVNGWQREEELAYPPGTLREVIVNAVAHRDYRLSGSQVLLQVYSDRVEVYSPGLLPGPMAVRNLLHERYSRNEALMQVLADMGFVERLGQGIDRMMAAARDWRLPAPEFRETETGVLVTLYGRGEGVVPAGVGPMGTMPIGATPIGAVQAGAEHRPLMAQNQRVERLMSFLRQSGQITNREYQELCPGVSSETLRRDFSELVDQGLILRVGDKRGTYYIARQR
jgi:ATP-dependent DNA helicase RecG